jgi:DNA-binding protein H-NS
MAANLGKLDVPALIKLRDAVEKQLASMRDTLTAQLAALGIGSGPKKRGRPAGVGKRTHALKGTKRPAKYRDPETGKTWAGVGMTPLWLREYEAAGKLRDQFAAKAGGEIGNAKKQRRSKKAARK